MDYTRLVSRMHRRARLTCNLERELEIETPRSADRVGERASLQVLHSDISANLGRDSEIVNRDDVTVLEPCYRECFAFEARPDYVVRQMVAAHDLERGRPCERELCGAVDRTHPAGPNESVDAVFAVDDRSK